VRPHCESRDPAEETSSDLCSLGHSARPCANFHPREEFFVIPWILVVLALFVVQTWLPGTIRYLLSGRGVGPRLRIALGSRDEQPPLSRLGGRAQRALDNMHEAMPVFLALAILHVFRRTPGELATTGSAVFSIARTAYVPAYISGIPGLRSAVWAVSCIGLGLMVVALRWS
jgi:uncharacterized MAPEG superfamily protein